MVVVVPSFTVGCQRNQPVVKTVVGGLVIAISPQMCARIHGPSDVPRVNDACDHAPNQHARPEPDALHELPRTPPADEKTGQNEQRRVRDENPNPPVASLDGFIKRSLDQIWSVLFQQLPAAVAHFVSFYEQPRGASIAAR